MDSITNVVSLQEQLDAHIKDELETKNFQKAINTFLNADSVKNSLNVLFLYAILLLVTLKTKWQH